jgi:hypothetical protein
MTRAEALLRTLAEQFPTVAGILGISLIRKPGAAVRLPGHLHYCAACDRQWRHRGAGWSCTLHWASACPKCPPYRAEG